MSAPGIGKGPHFSLPDFSAIERLPKPIKALVYLIIASVMTLAGIAALTATVVVIGEITGTVSLF